MILAAGGGRRHGRAATRRFPEGLESVAEIVVPQAAVKSGHSAGSSA
jgi:hypothetical protein